MRATAGQWKALLLAAALTLQACAGPRPGVGEFGAVKGHIGGVATVEPNAAVVAQDVLSAGGTAVDATVAAFFTLTVTYPVGAGIGGGGTCVVYDPKQNEAQTLEFLAGLPGKPGPFAVPGVVRGLAALHARYGRIAWSALVAPAERMARVGYTLSRALVTRLREVDAAGLLTPALRKPYENRDGSLKGEGEKVVDFELAGTLSRLRAFGAGTLYGGQAGRLLAEANQAVGGTVTLDDLRAYRPVWRQTRTLRFGDEVGHVALPPPAGGDVLAKLLEALRPASSRADAAQVLAATEKAYPAARPGQLGPAGDAVVVAGDREGSTVSCAFTMGRPFGTGQVAGQTGVLMAPVANREEAMLAPMLVANQNVRQGYLAIASTGGWQGPIATALVALALLEDGTDLKAALAAPRAVKLGPDGPVEREQGPPGTAGATSIGNVQVVWCPGGLVSRAVSCRYGTDPRGHGLARGQVF